MVEALLSSVSERLENAEATPTRAARVDTAEQVCERYFAFVWRNAQRLASAQKR